MKKTKGINNTLRKEKLVVILIIVSILIISCASVPVAISDPSEKDSIPAGPMIPVEPSPAPGFRYDPDDEIRLFGGWVDSWSYSNAGEDYYSDYYDDAFGDCSYSPRVFGPNVFSDFISFCTFAESSWLNCAYAFARDLAAYSYVITANQNVISFSADHIAGCTAYAEQSGYCAITYAGFSGGYYYPNDYDLTVRIPFYVSDSGFLFIKQADLTLLSMCTGEGPVESWGYSVGANAYWSIIGTGIGSNGELEVYDVTEPFGSQKFYDGWDSNEPRLFPIDAGFYCFYASYHSGHGGSAGAQYDNYASASVSASDQFTVTIGYLPLG